MENIKKAVLLAGITAVCFLGTPAFALVDNSQAIIEQQTVPSQDTQQPSQPQQSQTPAFAPGELIVKIKDGKTMDELSELNTKYDVTSTEGIFQSPGSPEDMLKSLQQKSADLDSQHDSWYWQMDKDSKEYKDYVAKIEAQKEVLKSQISAEQALIDHLTQRQSRADNSVTTPDLTNTYILKTNSSVNIVAIAENYSSHPAVEYAEPNYVRKVEQTSPILGPPPLPSWPYVLPNDAYVDPNHTNTWTKGAWGQAYEDMWGLKKIQADKAWRLSLGEGAIVAVIDTGVDHTHEDISGNIWINTREKPGNGIDDDGNGYVDDVRGWDFVNDSNDPKDGFGHGTHCAGTIAAIGNNKIGIIGVSPKAKIMPVKGLDDFGYGTDAALVKCIYYAANNGADILSNSWGGSGSSQVITDAVNYAYAKGCVVIASAGNSSADVKYFSPANIDKVIAVAATGQNDKLCLFSNFGNKIDVTAPGGDDTLTSLYANFNNVLSLLAPNSYLAKNYGADIVGYKYLKLAGTSMACPHVSGLAALLIAKYPADTNKQTRGRIMETADVLSQEPLYSAGLLGSGRINSYRALSEPFKPYFKFKDLSLKELSGDADQIPESGERIKLVIKLESIGQDMSVVKGAISTDSLYISRIDIPVSSFYRSQDGTMDNSNSPFVFTIGKVEYQSPVNIKLTINAGGSVQMLNLKINLGIRQLPIDYNTYKIGAYSLYNNKIAWDRTTVDSHVGYVYSGEVYLYDIKSNQVKQISANDGRIKAWPAMYENKIACLDKSSPYSNWNVFLYDLTAKTATFITQDSFNHRDPAIYKNKIVWSDDRNGNNDIYLYDIDKKQERRITTNPAGQITPKIYGNKIAWIDFRNGPYDWYRYDICVYDLDKNEEKMIPRGGSNVLWPIDIFGNKVVWADNNNIYLYDLDKNEQKLISSRNYQYYITSLRIYGNKIIWDDSVSGNSVQVFMYDLNTNQKTMVTKDQYAVSPMIYARNITWLNWNDDIYKPHMYIAEIPDITPPIGSIRINNGALYTRSPIVTLNLYAQDDESGMGNGAQMQFSNDGARWSAPGPYVTSKLWPLTPGIGLKIVYVRFKDAAGNWSRVYSAYIKVY